MKNENLYPADRYMNEVVNWTKRKLARERKRQMAGKGWVEKFEVIGSQGDVYIVARKADGTYGCSCPHWKFHKAPKPNCKHIKSMLGVTVEVNLALVRPDLFGTGRRFRGEDGNLILRATKVENATMEIIVEKIEIEGELFSVKRRFRDV